MMASSKDAGSQRWFGTTNACTTFQGRHLALTWHWGCVRRGVARAPRGHGSRAVTTEPCRIARDSVDYRG